MKSHRACWLLLPSIALTAGAASPETKPAASQPKNEPRIVKMTIRPAPAPVPTLEVRLQPDIFDQLPGNAAIMYYSAALLMETRGRQTDDARDKYDLWSRMPLDKLPREDLNRFLSPWRDALHALEIATLRDRCDWDLPIRTEGFSLLMPHLAKLRDAARLLCLRTRLHVAEGDVDAALRDLRTGYTMARHIGQGPTIIQNLVAVAIARMVSEQTEALIASGQGPNLYWALTALPRPFVDSSLAFEWERAAPFLNWPALRDPEAAHLTQQEWIKIGLEMVDIFNNVFPPDPKADKLAVLMAGTARMLPKAKRYLEAKGLSPEKIEAMFPLQAIAVYQVDHYKRWRDDFFKWWYLPYWQGWKGVSSVQDALERTRDGDDSATFARAVLASLGKAYRHIHCLDRRIAELRTIEAIRLHAAAHEGKLPNSLTEITIVPVPIDPITGQSLRYALKGDTAILETDPPPPLSIPASPGEYGRYELIIVH
ncbi:MAG: hypothetical protein JXQ73_01525 [Phycisphaerae bacterium]|nr:hypothetical protein [Phycisphaerae bacterium]